MSIIDINDSPMKFGPQRNTLILGFWTRGSGFQLSHQDKELILDKYYNVLLKFFKFI